LVNNATANINKRREPKEAAAPATTAPTSAAPTSAAAVEEETPAVVTGAA
jgi:hypothetical protein